MPLKSCFRAYSSTADSNRDVAEGVIAAADAAACSADVAHEGGVFRPSANAAKSRVLDLVIEEAVVTKG